MILKNELSEEELRNVSLMTEGYSGADMANLCREAAYGPIRSLDMKLIASLRADQVRPINHGDLISALRQVKASVSKSRSHSCHHLVDHLRLLKTFNFPSNNCICAHLTCSVLPNSLSDIDSVMASNSGVDL